MSGSNAPLLRKQLAMATATAEGIADVKIREAMTLVGAVAKQKSLLSEKIETDVKIETKNEGHISSGFGMSSMLRSGPDKVLSNVAARRGMGEKTPEVAVANAPVRRSMA